MDPAAALLLSGNPREAIPFLINRTDVSSRLNLTVAYRQLGQFDAALHTLLPVLDSNPERYEGWNSLGMIQTDLGQFEMARIGFDNAIQHLTDATPDNARSQAMVNYAYSLMRLGRFDEAWPFWEAGRYGSSWHSQFVPWAGQAGKVLVICEGGFGDQILFSRWFPLMREMGVDITFYLWESLAVLFRKVFPGLRIIPHTGFRISQGYADVGAENFDYATSILSLPGICGMKSFHDIPPSDPEWFNTPVNVNPHTKGLCWDAEELGVQRRTRSIPIDELTELDNIDGPWQSLCPGRDTPEWVMPFTGKSWLDTRRILTSMEYVVTVDTAVAHLAGAMDIPTVLILPCASDWKYGTEEMLCGTSPWYRSVRLIRSKDADSWRKAIQHTTSILPLI